MAPKSTITWAGSCSVTRPECQAGGRGWHRPVRGRTGGGPRRRPAGRRTAAQPRVGRSNRQPCSVPDCVSRVSGRDRRSAPIMPYRRWPGRSVRGPAGRAGRAGRAGPGRGSRAPTASSCSGTGPPTAPCARRRTAWWRPACPGRAPHQLPRSAHDADHGGGQARRRGPFVLVPTLVATADLLAPHARLDAVLGEPVRPFLAPGAWVPRVTLAPRPDPGADAAAAARRSTPCGRRRRLASAP